MYYRQGAKRPTLQLTLQQLLTVLETEIADQATDLTKLKLPKPLPYGDFTLSVSELNEIEDQHEQVFGSTSYWTKLDPRRIDDGVYQFSDDMASGRRPRKYRWFAQVSVQAALWIVARYVDKFLISRKMSSFTDRNVVVSKRDLRGVLAKLLRKLDS